MPAYQIHMLSIFTLLLTRYPFTLASHSIVSLDRTLHMPYLPGLSFVC